MALPLGPLPHACGSQALSSGASWALGLSGHLGPLPLWPLVTLASLALWAFGLPGLWAYGLPGLWAYGLSGLWAYGLSGPLGQWPFNLILPIFSLNYEGRARHPGVPQGLKLTPNFYL